MIREDYVSFEVAKLLKEKGFDWDCQYCYIDEDDSDKEQLEVPTGYDAEIEAPTHQMAMKWLREAHKLNIELVLNQDVQDLESVIKNYYHFNVSRLDRFANEGGDCKFYNSYEEAVEAAIKYCLENLI